jgi:hypothetical protein
MARQYHLFGSKLRTIAFYTWMLLIFSAVWEVGSALT